MAELATIARPYAEALYQVAQKADVAAWGRQIQALAEVASNADLRQFADSPKISATQVYDVIASAVKMPLDAGVQNFLRTVIENGRLAALPAVAEQFQALANAVSIPFIPADTSKENYTLAHSGNLVLLGPDGRQHGFICAPLNTQKLLEQLPGLLSTKE